MFKLLPLLLATGALAQCVPGPMVFDGRFKRNMSLATLDGSSSPFNPNYDLGEGLKWSQVITLPTPVSSMFDAGALPIEVNIDDRSIFASSPTNVQNAFRRADLLPMSNSGTDASTTGIKTLHFSIKQDDQHLLNFTHEYQIAWLETGDYSANQWALKTGIILGGTGGNPVRLNLVGNTKGGPEVTLFSVPFPQDIWHNFGLKMDFTKNTVQVLYSINNNPLNVVSAVTPNDLTGRGQYHFGLLKKPRDSKSGNIAIDGYQERGIHEGMYFGGIYMEDSSNGCVSIQPNHAIKD